MKPVLILFLILAFVGGLLVFSLRLVGAASAQETAAASAAPSAGLEGAELAELRRAISELGARVERLELAPPTAPSAVAPEQRVAADVVTPEELQEMRDMVAALKDPAAATGVPFEDLVLGVIDNRERIEQERRDQARREAAAERIEQRVAELAEELGLSSFQSGEMLSILTDEQVERDAFFSEMRESGSFDRTAIREGMETIRTTALAGVEQVLSPDQYASYLESNPDFFGGFRGAGGGGRDAGGPGR